MNEQKMEQRIQNLISLSESMSEMGYTIERMSEMIEANIEGELDEEFLEWVKELSEEINVMSTSFDQQMKMFLKMISEYEGDPVN